MMKKNLLAGILILAVLLSACTQPYRAQTIAVTPSPTGPFAGQDAAKTMAALQATGAAQTTAQPPNLTAAALTGTVVSNGTAITPVTQITFTPTPNIGGALTTVPTTPVVVCTPPPACGAGQSLVCQSGTCAGGCGMVCAAVTASSTPITPQPQGARPATYTLHNGEFPYCLARRYDVNPDDLLALSGLSDGVYYPAGTLLRIPQSGSFPGDTALRAHPVGTTYTVTSADETVYSIACLFGDVYPETLAQVNNMSVSTPLSIGQVLKIP